MVNHEKKWLLFEDKSRSFYEKDFKNVFASSSHRWYDFFYKEIYAFEFSPTNCIYEMERCILEPDDIVVDLGANVGFFTDYAANKCKKVISVEGGDALFGCLIRNTYENKSCQLCFGTFGIQAIEKGYLTVEQIEAVRRTRSSPLKRKGKI